MNKKVIIYCDGSCNNRTGAKGGYGIVLINGHIRTFMGGSYIKTTSARMELLGAVRALQKCSVGERVELWCDNEYVVNTLREGWIFRWSIEGWRNRKNKDLLKLLLSEYNRLERRVEFKWLKGHEGHEGNELADELARQGGWREEIIVDTKQITR